MGAAAAGNGHVSPNLLSNPRNPDSRAGELSQRGYLATRLKMTGAVSRNRRAIFCGAESIFTNNFSGGFVDAHLLLDAYATPMSEHLRPAEDTAPHRGFRATAGRADAVPSPSAVQSLLPPHKVVPPIRVR